MNNRSYAAQGLTLPPRRITSAITLDPRPAPPPGPAARQNLQGWVVPQAQVRWLGPGVAWYSPQRVEQLFRQALAGDLRSQWEMFDLMESTWPCLSKCLNQIKDAVVSQGLRVVPFTLKGSKSTSQAEQRAAFIESALHGMVANPARDENDLEDTIRDLLDARGKGISIVEIDWQLQRGRAISPSAPSQFPGRASSPSAPSQFEVPISSILPRCTRWVHPAWYGYPQGPGGSTLMLRQATVAPTSSYSFPGDTSTAPRPASPATRPSTPAWQPFPPHKFIIGVAKNKVGHPLGSAMLHVLGFWWAASNLTAEWFLNFCQVFGQPFRWATYNQNMAPDDQIKLQAMLTNMGANAWGMFPEGTQFELKDIARQGDNVQTKLMELADKVCTLVVLRQTLTTDVGGSGSRALGEVHERVLGGVEEACCKWICKTLHPVVASILQLNFGDTSESPTLVPGMDEEASPEELGSLLVAVNNANLQPTQEALPELSERLGFTVERKAQPIIPPSPFGPTGSDENTESDESRETSDEKGAPVPPPATRHPSPVPSPVTAGRSHTTTAETLGVPPAWLNPLRDFFTTLEQKAADQSLTHEDLLTFLDQAQTRVPELFHHMDIDELARTLEAAMGQAVMDGLRQRLRQKPELAGAPTFLPASPPTP